MATGPILRLVVAPRETISFNKENLARALSRLLMIAMLATGAGACVLAGAIIFYDGPLLSFGPGGVWILQSPDDSLGLVALVHFSRLQRLCGALAIGVLVAPVVFILWQAKILTKLFADRVLFALEAERGFTLLAIGFFGYGAAPPLVHASMVAAGVTGDPKWFGFDAIGAFLLAGFFILLSRVMAAARAVESDRDGFV